MDSRDIAQKAYDYLLEQVNVNIDKFSLAGINPVDAGRDAWGIRIPQRQQTVFNGKTCKTVICIAKGKFRELLAKGNFEEPSVIIKKFKQREWLDHESKRDTRHRKITETGTAIDVYALRVFSDKPEDDLGEVRYEPAKRKPATKSNKTKQLDKRKPFATIYDDDEQEGEIEPTTPTEQEQAGIISDVSTVV